MNILSLVNRSGLFASAFFTLAFFACSQPQEDKNVGQQFGPSSAVNENYSQKFVSADDSRFAYIGRVSHAVKGCVSFTYPGVSVLANFTGTSLSAVFKPGSGYFMVEIDDHSPIKIFVSENDSIMGLAEGLPDTSHSLRVMYCQEGYEQRPAFYGLLTESGQISSPNLSDRRLLFVGNSITCGYGIEAFDPQEHFLYSTENHYYTYAAIAARTLNAQHHAIARSGIGIYRNYGAPVEGSKGTAMPDKFDLTLFTDDANIQGLERWNHSLYQPQVVCVNLGTNDTSLDTYDTELMHQAYVSFIQRLRSLYPKAHIVMLSGSMMGGKALADCNAVLDAAVKEVNDAKVLRFNFSPQTGSLGFGADYHPSLAQQRMMADELIPFLKQITGWE